MKHRVLAIFLALALLAAPSALASQALGWELYQTDTVLGPGLTVSSQILWGDSKQDYRREQYVTYTPGLGVQPVVCYGASVPATATLTSMAKGLEGYGYRVLAGANGDYFVMSSGVPLGMVVSYGALRSSSSYHYAVGFEADGTCFVGKPDLSITATFHGYDLSVSGGYNKLRETQSGYTLYSSDFGGETRTTGGGVNVVLRPVTVPEDYAAPAMPEALRPAPEEPPAPEGLDQAADPEVDPAEVDPAEVDPVWAEQHRLWEEEMAAWEQEKLAWEQAMADWRQALAQSVAGFETLPAQLTIGGEVDCVVETVAEQSGSFAIPQGRFVLSISTGADRFLVDEVRALMAGERLRLRVTSPDERWARAYTAIGAYRYILQNGEVAQGLEQNGDPRTALGIRADGAVILYTIDGRRPGHSVGASVTQVAKRLQELGCVEAVLFDGGGSTTFGTTGALDQSFSLQNRPSEGSQRAVSDALFFVSELKPTGALGSVYLRPQSALMLAGARQSLSALGIDTGYYAMGEEPLVGVSYTVEGPGRMEGEVFVAGAEKGIATVTAATADGAVGTARMTVVATPDKIDLTDPAGQKVTSLNLDPGQSASLNASATWYKLDLLADDSCFTWTLSPELGSVDAYGNLTAGTRAGSGTLTVSAGERSVSIPVTVGGHVTPLEPWESPEGIRTGPEDPVQAELTGEQTRYGRSALRVTYPAGEESRLPLDLAIPAGESWLALWLYADTPPQAVEAELALDDGSAARVPLAVPEGSQGSWSHLWAAIPENAVRLTGLVLTARPRDGGEAPGAYLDTLYLDHFTTANSRLDDATPPTVSLTVRGGQVSATLSDNVDKTFRPEAVSLTLDGWGTPFDLSGGALTASLPTDALLHRVSLTVQDASGNLKRVSAELPPAPGRALPFGDVAGHWAQDHIVYLYDQGVTNGRSTPEGPVFDPQTNITRGEFATMLARWLRADLTGGGEVQLPFVDAADIPAWARDAVGYLYRAGIMSGSLEGDGLYARAGDPITRAQAMTLLGRVQPKGFAQQAGTFDDDDQIPAWAREFVYTLAGQGVVSGYQGLVRPLDPITRAEAAKLLTTLW